MEVGRGWVKLHRKKKKKKKKEQIALEDAAEDNLFLRQRNV